MTWLSAAVRSDALVLSAQSLREFYFVVLRMDRSPAAAQALRAEVAALDVFVPPTLRQDWLADAWAIEDAYRFSFFDCLLLASALVARCTIFLSEDLQAGQTIGALTIVNPFQTAPEAAFG